MNFNFVIPRNMSFQNWGEKIQNPLHSSIILLITIFLHMCWSELPSTFGGISSLNSLQYPCSFINLVYFSSSTSLQDLVEMAVSFHVHHWCPQKIILHMVTGLAHPLCCLLPKFSLMHPYGCMHFKVAHFRQMFQSLKSIW